MRARVLSISYMLGSLSPLPIRALLALGYALEKKEDKIKREPTLRIK